MKQPYNKAVRVTASEVQVGDVIVPTPEAGPGDGVKVFHIEHEKPNKYGERFLFYFGGGPYERQTSHQIHSPASKLLVLRGAK